jgi:hypothetical protein
MLNIALITQFCAVIFFVAVGIRLFLLGRRTGEIPEKLLGVYFFVTGFAYVGWAIPTVYALGDAAVDQIDLATWTLYSIGVVPFAYFTRIAFRPNAAWAKWLLITSLFLLFSGMTMWIVQAHVNYSLESPWFWSQWLGYTIPCIWLGLEAFLAYASANRRARIGLCDRMVANRYLLFGFFGAFQTFACITDVYLARAAMDNNMLIDDGLDVLLGSFEMVGIVMLFLAFFPPAFYQRWVSGANTHAAEPVDG